MSPETAAEKLRKKVVGAFGGDGVAITEILLRATNLGLVGRIQSSPPPGMCEVSRIYVNLDTGRLVVEYDDEPV